MFPASPLARSKLLFGKLLETSVILPVILLPIKIPFASDVFRITLFM